MLDTPIKAGDVFAFSYNEATRVTMFAPHHCFDGQLVAQDTDRGIIFSDTYWGFSGHGDVGRWFTVEEARAKGTLRFICNIADVEDVRSESATRYYRPEDVFNLSYQHGCYKRWAVRKGAERDKGRILAEIHAKRSSVQQDVEFAVRKAMSDMRQLAVLEHKAESGDVLDLHIWW